MKDNRDKTKAKSIKRLEDIKSLLEEERNERLREMEEINDWKKENNYEFNLMKPKELGLEELEERKKRK